MYHVHIKDAPGQIGILKVTIFYYIQIWRFLDSHDDIWLVKKTNVLICFFDDSVEAVRIWVVSMMIQIYHRNLMYC